MTGQEIAVPAAAITAAALVLRDMRPAAAPYTDEPTGGEITWAGLILEAAAPHLDATRMQLAIDTLTIGASDIVTIRAAGHITQDDARNIADQAHAALRRSGIQAPVLVTDDSARITAEPAPAERIAELGQQHGGGGG